MDKVAERLIKARINAGHKNARTAAAALGVPYTTYYNHEKGTRGLKPEQAEDYADKFKVSLAWLLTGDGDGGLSPIKMPISDFIPVLGSVAAGLWQEIDAALDEPDGYIPYMPTLKHPSDCYFALVVRGKSMNKLFPDGATLMCLDVAKSGINVMDGDIAIVERRKEQDGLREVTAKRVRKNGGSLELWPESTEPQFQSPVVINGNHDNIDIVITAKVVGVYNEM